MLTTFFFHLAKAKFYYLRYVEHCGRPISVRVLPIGIPFARFEQMSKVAPSILPQDSKVDRNHARFFKKAPILKVMP